MKKKINQVFIFCKRVLRYLRINDEQNRLSLTNLAMMLILYKMWVTQALSMGDLTAIAVTIIGYQAKGFISRKLPAPLMDPLDSIASYIPSAAAEETPAVTPDSYDIGSGK
jgi:hypothetical protein